MDTKTRKTGKPSQQKDVSAEDMYAAMAQSMLARLTILEEDLHNHRAPDDGGEYTWKDVADIAYMYTVIENAYYALHEDEK